MTAAKSPARGSGQLCSSVRPDRGRVHAPLTALRSEVRSETVVDEPPAPPVVPPAAGERQPPCATRWVVEAGEEERTVQRGIAGRALDRGDGRRARLSRRCRRLGARACGGRLRRRLRGRLGDGLGRSNGRGDGRGGLGRRRLAALHLDALAVELVGRDARPAVDAGRRALEAAPAALSPGLSGRGRPTVEASRVGVTGLDERGRDKAEGDEVGEEAHAERRKEVAARPAGRWR